MTELTSINTNLFVTLRVLLQERSVGRAAKRLRLSQPAVSNHLAKLREIFDDELLVRVGNGMELTERARHMLPTLEGGLGALESLLEDAQAFDPTQCRRDFRLAMADIAEAALLPGLLSDLSALAPQASLQIFPASVFAVSAALLNGQLDACVTIVDTETLPTGLYAAKIDESQFRLIARRGHPRVTPVMTPGVYAALEHIVVTSRPGALGVIDDVLSEMGLSRRIALRLPRSVLVPALVARTDLVAAVDASALLPYADALELQEFEVPDLVMPRGPVSLLWHERTHKSPEHRWFRELVRDQAR